MTSRVPRPVLTSTGIAGGITGVAGVLGFLGFANAATSLSGAAQGIGAAIVGTVAIGSHLLAGLHAQGKVSPVDAFGNIIRAGDAIVHQFEPVAERLAPAELHSFETKVEAVFDDVTGHLEPIATSEVSTVGVDAAGPVTVDEPATTDTADTGDADSAAAAAVAESPAATPGGVEQTGPAVIPPPPPAAPPAGS